MLKEARRERGRVQVSNWPSFIKTHCHLCLDGELNLPVLRSDLPSPADDEYDLDDDFIDDSDLLEVFEKQEQAENAITKYKGFFVNCGDLEISGHKVSIKAGR